VEAVISALIWAREAMAVFMGVAVVAATTCSL
jgi:hypothetical protein